MSWTKRRIRNNRCQCYDGQPCPYTAVGDVWPPKRIGEAQGASVRACAVHLNEAQDRGWTVSRDAHVALFGNQE